MGQEFGVNLSYLLSYLKTTKFWDRICGQLLPKCLQFSPPQRQQCGGNLSQTPPDTLCKDIITVRI